MKKKLLEILACPKCKSALIYDSKHARLICEVERVFYPIKDGIPILLESEAEKIQDIN